MNRRVKQFITRSMIRSLRVIGRIPLVGDAIVKASFDAVRQGWSDRSWIFQGLQDSWIEIDAATRMELQRLHDSLIENSCIVQKIRNLYLQFSVGPSGLICTPNASRMSGPVNTQTEKEGVENWNDARAASWERWWRKPELNCEISGAQLTRVWAGLLFDKGEIFVNLTNEEAKDARGVIRSLTPKIQTIDAHRCQTPADTRDFEGRVIHDGVEITQTGKVVAYWFKKTNFDSLLTDGLSGRELFDRVPAYDKNGRKQIIHKFKVRRPGQIRGIPEGFSVYNICRDNMDLHKLEMQAAKLASAMGNVETNPAGELDTLTNRRSRVAIGTQNAAGAAITKNSWYDYKVSVGSQNVALRTGDKLDQFMITRPTVATQDYWDLHYTLICMGYNVPKLLVMPYSLQGTVTRADLDICGFGFGREHFEIISELLTEIYEWQTDWAVKYDRTMDGQLPEDYLSVFIRPPRAPNVDIGYTAKAKEIELKLGITTLQDVYAEKQQNWRTQVVQINEALKFIRETAAQYGNDPALVSTLMVSEAQPTDPNQSTPTADETTKKLEEQVAA